MAALAKSQRVAAFLKAVLSFNLSYTSSLASFSGLLLQVGKAGGSLSLEP